LPHFVDRADNRAGARADFRAAVTVVIPTLAADSAILNCLRSLEEQIFRDFEVIVVDNSGTQAARGIGVSGPNLRIIENGQNAGFGGAINQGWRDSQSPFVATLNDDAVAEPHWLQAMVRAADRDPEIGLVAAQVRLSDQELDSAGMLLSSDGSSKQRGHGDSPSGYVREEDVLLPSGSAALYRREMLEDTGGFAEEFFLYCEDTDLGLRARLRGWRAVYAPDAVVYHGYSKSAGRASELKAFLVERNRLYLVLRTFPVRMLWRVPFVAAVRYFWHLAYMIQGRGKASEFQKETGEVRVCRSSF